MEQQMHNIINEVYNDLCEACEQMGEPLDAESLADTVGDRMCDTNEEYRAMPYPERRALTLKVAKQYV